MEDMVQKGYAEKSFQQVQQGKTWFIPHHGEYHPSKPGKIRVVFDCSAEYDGVSINKKLMSVPDFTNQIISILVKFRKDFVAVMADIEAFVADQHRNLLSFLWWENGHISEQHQQYHMNVHAFGGTSSPSCSNYSLQRTARDYEQKYGKEVADTLRVDLYVDNLPKSVQDKQTAIKLMKDVTSMCAEGGSWITKFVSNNKDVLVSIPEGERRKGLQDQELRLGTLTTEKALGIHWNIEKDKLGFDVNFKDNPYTKRGMLSMVSSIYDPLGLVSPFVLEGRQIIHMLSLSQLAWDDPVDKDVQEKWIKWKLSLKKLHEIKVDRCYKPKGFGKVVIHSLHYFSDA